MPAQPVRYPTSFCGEPAKLGMDFSRMFDEGRKPSLAVTVVTVKPGFTCKFNGCPCEIIGVSAAGMSADLRVAATGERLRIVSATELRCVLAPASVEAV